MTTAAPLLAAHGLALGYGRRPVVRDIELELRAGEYWIVLGPNGTGKSTFLRAIVGLVAPLAGRLWRDETRVPQGRIGFVPQRCEVRPTVPTTAREFVLLGTVGLDLDRQERRERVQWALQHAGLGELARRDLRGLSGGQRQRALVARALVRRPRLLLLDEPATHLDQDAERRLADLLAQLHDDGITIVMVTHDLRAAERSATHAAIFRDGRVRVGTRDEMHRLLVAGEGGR